jgi:choline monooxygenase
MSQPIDPDISKSMTLPSRFYTENESFREIVSSFGNCWHFAAHRSQLEGASSIPLNHMEAMVGEAMALTISEEVRCLSNVCTHRGMILVTEKCNSSSIKCGYHGRTFGLDGCFRNMPEFGGVKNFPSDQDNLPEFPIMEWKGIIFTGITPSRYDSVFDVMEERIGWMPIDEFQHDESRHRSYEIDANWALYVDNYLEGFHIPFVHGDLHDALDYDSYSTELFEGGVLQIGIANGDEDTFDLPDSSPDFGKRVAAYYYWLFPGVMLNFYPWGLSVNIVIPISVRRTKIVYHGFVWDESKLGKGAGGDLDKVEEEDQHIVEATQRGVSSSSYDRGRYSTTRETGVHHFHRMLFEDT